MTTQPQQPSQIPERPETSKFYRVSRSQNRTKTQMRSTVSNWQIDQNDHSPFVKRKLTLDNRKEHVSPKPVLRPTSQEKPFRSGITLQQYFIEQQQSNLPDPQEKEEDGLFFQEFNFQIEQRDDDDQEENLTKSKQLHQLSRKKLQQAVIQPQEKSTQLSNTKNPWRQRQPAKVPNIPSSMVDRNRKTTMQFYKSRNTRKSIEEYEATEEYLLRKYANKFHLNEIHQQSRVEKIINRNHKQSTLGGRSKIV